MRLSRLELSIMDALWSVGPASVREIQEAMPRRRPAGLHDGPDDRVPAGGEGRRSPREENWQRECVRTLITQGAARTKLVDDLLSVFGGSAQPFMAHLIETGRITREDLDEARRRLDELSKPTKSKGKQR